MRANPQEVRVPAVDGATNPGGGKVLYLAVCAVVGSSPAAHRPSPAGICEVSLGSSYWSSFSFRLIFSFHRLNIRPSVDKMEEYEF